MDLSSLGVAGLPAGPLARCPCCYRGSVHINADFCFGLCHFARCGTASVELQPPNTQLFLHSQTAAELVRQANNRGSAAAAAQAEADRACSDFNAASAMARTSEKVGQPTTSTCSSAQLGFACASCFVARIAHPPLPRTPQMTAVRRHCCGLDHVPACDCGSHNGYQHWGALHLRCGHALHAHGEAGLVLALSGGACLRCPVHHVFLFACPVCLAPFFPHQVCCTRVVAVVWYDINCKFGRWFKCWAAAQNALSAVLERTAVLFPLPCFHRYSHRWEAHRCCCLGSHSEYSLCFRCLVHAFSLCIGHRLHWSRWLASPAAVRPARSGMLVCTCLALRCSITSPTKLSGHAWLCWA